MPHPKKLFAEGQLVLISSRTQKGLPLPPNDYMNEIIKSTLARAQALYPIEVNQYIFMSNHFHIFATIGENPENLPKFIGYLKAEIAHAINQFMDRKKNTIWEDGYDSPILLTFEDAIRYIIYIFLNPANAGLVNSIDEYPGVSSWNMFLNAGKEETKYEVQSIARSSIFKLDDEDKYYGNEKRNQEILDRLLSASKTKIVFKLSPNSWMDHFEETKGLSEKEKQEINQKIISEVRKQEEELKEKRKAEGKEVLGAEKLKVESICGRGGKNDKYVPEKRSPRMVCISSCKTIRDIFLALYKDLCQKGKDVYEIWKNWKEGDILEKFPNNMFPPRPPFCEFLKMDEMLC